MARYGAGRLETLFSLVLLLISSCGGPGHSTSPSPPLPADAGAPEIEEKDAEPTAEPSPEEPTTHQIPLDWLAIPQRVFFARGSAKLSADASTILEDVAAALHQFPQIAKVRVVGFRAAKERAQGNKRDLPLERARAVRDHLVSLGVTPERLEAIDGGIPESEQGCPEPACSRRVEFEIEHGPDGRDSAQIGAQPVRFPCEEDTSAIGDSLSDYTCWAGSKLFALPHPIALCIRTNESGSEITDRLVLHRDDHRWELLQLPEELLDEELIGDALYTEDDVLYLAGRKRIHRIDRQGRRTTVRGKGMKHPAAIWSCGGDELVVASFDRIEHHYYWEWDRMSATGHPDLYRKGVLRLHVIRDRGDCLLPRAAMMPMFLECGGDGPTLHVLTDDRSGDITRCGLRVRRHALKPLWGAAYPAGLSFADARILFCRSTGCEDGLRTICNVDFLEAMPAYENRLIEIGPDGDSVAAPRPGEKTIALSLDAVPGCDKKVYSTIGNMLVEGEWIEARVSYPDSRVADSNGFFDQHGVMITSGLEGIGRLFAGRLEPVILWKEHRPMLPGHP